MGEVWTLAHDRISFHGVSAASDVLVPIGPVCSALVEVEAQEVLELAEDVESKTAAELVEAQGTPGLTRRTAFEGDGHWFGHVEAEANTMSGWHHHGENTTFGYGLKGRVRVEYGPGGSLSAEVGEGEFFTVPAGAIHREGNPSDEVAEVVIVRFGEGPPVFPADGPEPA